MRKYSYIHAYHSLDIIIDENSKILILGSFPSIVSREKEFYYMNSRNRFWMILSKIYNEDFINVSKEEKKKLLLKHNIALYDVIEECDIVASKDSSIKNVKYVDLEKLLNEYKIKYVLCNGNKAYNLLSKKYIEYQDIIISLPSTSPANARIKDEEIINIWKNALVKDDE